MAEVNVTILGLERLGASFGLALKRYMAKKDAKHSFTITGYDKRGYNAKTAKKMAAIDTIEHDSFKAVRGSHIIIMAGGYNTIEQLYGQIGPDLQPGAVVIDCSPLKKPSIKWAAEHLPSDADIAAYMVGVTPILNPAVLYDADTEVEKAHDTLFDDGSFLLAPSVDCPAEAVELAAEVARIVGAGIHFMDPDEHDGLLSAGEGLPAALAVAYFQMFIRSGSWQDMQRVTNPAFGLLTSPLRFQHPDAIWGLLHYNRENIARHLDGMIDSLTQMRDALRDDEEGLAVESVVVEASSRYEEWEKHRLANRWDDEKEDMPQGNVFSQMGGMFFGRRGGDDKKDK